uniref:Diacylglycerol kinase n=1 Tax=Chromera velia CCMP2878 TaxID=1169474 RepID=A0A0G4GAF9_9ALVE|eukprot:Cvel_20988.t1-p1 / transcript=Cvel_20988.t1 / gene=Cvel_20988 / organism=Chromera_velia_CCMP2878 / gene_product=Diacylglycerol kinase 1, putative / transcript_product=Diacylglycerol kinase 1, putative / location=Cvel_scaffold1932:11201-13845(+) / protein_length=554 / sequence_SO=supercontig / SO=protein_coding / is_pseudo=false
MLPAAATPKRIGQLRSRLFGLSDPIATPEMATYTPPSVDLNEPAGEIAEPATHLGANVAGAQDEMIDMARGSVEGGVVQGAVPDLPPYENFRVGSISAQPGDLLQQPLQLQLAGSILPVDTFFLFVNPSSGGNQAGTFTSAGVETLIFKHPAPAQVHIFDITEGQHGDKPGFRKLKAEVASVAAATPAGTQPRRVRCLAAGGDGTVLWALSELEAHGVALDSVAVGVIPYGTGNDFSRALGWVSSRTARAWAEAALHFRALLTRWLHAEVTRFDLWNVEVHIQQGGSIQKIDSKTRKKKKLLDTDNTPILTKSSTFCNYFSCGFESKVGIGFDRNRKKSALANKMVYMTEGMKKMYCCHSIMKIDEIFEKMVKKNSDGTEEVVFMGVEHGKHAAQSKDDTAHPYFAKQPVSLVAINIGSMMGGCDVWRNAGRKVNLKNVDKATVEKLKSSPQNMGDKQLEFITFPSGSAFGMEQVFPGQGYRVHQGPGPWELTFRRDLGDTRVYIQIDGEFYQLDHPDRILLRHDKQVNVLDASEKKIPKKITKAEVAKFEKES